MIWVVMLSLLVLFVLLWFLTRSGTTKRKAVKVSLCLAGFAAVLVAAGFVLLSDYEEPSRVNITPLQQLGDELLPDYETRQASLEETRFFVSKGRGVYNYEFTYYDRPSAEMTVYVLQSPEEAYDNLLYLPDVREEKIERLSGTVLLYRGDSRMRRDSRGFMFEDLSRRVETYFIIGSTLFSLRETGDAEKIGDTSGEILAMLSETVFTREE
jgi:hypothetical protein